MVSRSFTQKTIEPFYMNSLPFHARKVGTLFFREYRLDELVNMLISCVDRDLEERFKLAPDVWKLTLRYLILTKLTSFTLQSQLTPEHLTRLYKIAALALEKPQASLKDLIKETEGEAQILSKWLQQIQTALSKKT
ncbi:hypothetical protein [Hydrogenovibrio kuenenii]|uniref:hypothetical protein n=1 Tax=Hydrogenovibrio kuenenii TaxID=63658 RepID=UPI0004631A39|nr:hypothetical protein [Hydrogenovibrio kuenenii]